MKTREKFIPSTYTSNLFLTTLNHNIGSFIGKMKDMPKHGLSVGSPEAVYFGE